MPSSKLWRRGLPKLERPRRKASVCRSGCGFAPRAHPYRRSHIEAQLGRGRSVPQGQCCTRSLPRQCAFCFVSFTGIRCVQCSSHFLFHGWAKIQAGLLRSPAPLAGACPGTQGFFRQLNQDLAVLGVFPGVRMGCRLAYLGSQHDEVLRRQRWAMPAPARTCQPRTRHSYPLVAFCK